MTHGTHVYPFNDERQKLLRLSWNFQHCFLYLFKKYHIFCFDFLSRTVKKLLVIFCFLFLKIYDSAQFNSMFQNSVLGSSIMSEELIEL